MYSIPCVHLVVDDPIQRNCLSKAVEDLAYHVQHHSSGAAFLENVAHLKRGCVILAVHMPEIDGLEILRRMNAAGVNLPVVMLDGHDLPLAVEAIKLGAVDFLERPYDTAALQAALEEGLGRLSDERAADAVAAAARETVARLTPRELDVLRGLMVGSANKSIARDLGISPRTVEFHRSNLLDKLGVRGHSGAFRIALEAGLSAAA